MQCGRSSMTVSPAGQTTVGLSKRH